MTNAVNVVLFLNSLKDFFFLKHSSYWIQSFLNDQAIPGRVILQFCKYLFKKPAYKEPNLKCII